MSHNSSDTKPPLILLIGYKAVNSGPGPSTARRDRWRVLASWHVRATGVKVLAIDPEFEALSGVDFAVHLLGPEHASGSRISAAHTQCGPRKTAIASQCNKYLGADAREDESLQF
jgi:hypothetical protein